MRLVRRMQHGPAILILNAINSATVDHERLNRVGDCKVGEPHGGKPGDQGEDGRTMALGVISGLLALRGR